MTANEMELLNMIRQSDDPVRAMQVAVDIICQYIGQHESFEGPSAADLQARA